MDDLYCDEKKLAADLIKSLEIDATISLVVWGRKRYKNAFMYRKFKKFEDTEWFYGT